MKRDINYLGMISCYYKGMLKLMKPDMLEIILLYLDITYKILYHYVCLDAIADFEMFMITIYFESMKSHRK